MLPWFATWSKTRMKTQRANKKLGRAKASQANSIWHLNGQNLRQHHCLLTLPWARSKINGNPLRKWTRPAPERAAITGSNATPHPRDPRARRERIFGVLDESRRGALLSRACSTDASWRQTDVKDGAWQTATVGIAAIVSGSAAENQKHAHLRLSALHRLDLRTGSRRRKRECTVSTTHDHNCSQPTLRGGGQRPQSSKSRSWPQLRPSSSNLRPLAVGLRPQEIWYHSQTLKEQRQRPKNKNRAKKGKGPKGQRGERPEDKPKAQGRSNLERKDKGQKRTKTKLKAQKGQGPKWLKKQRGERPEDKAKAKGPKSKETQGQRRPKSQRPEACRHLLINRCAARCAARSGGTAGSCLLRWHTWRLARLLRLDLRLVSCHWQRRLSRHGTQCGQHVPWRRLLHLMEVWR